MNPRTYVKDIAGSASGYIEDCFMVGSKSISLTKTDQRFMSLLLRDRTGTIEARLWEEDLVDKYGPLFEKGDIIQVTGKRTFFQGKAQLKVERIEKPELDDSAETLGKFYRQSRYGRQEMEARLLDTVGRITNPFLQEFFVRFQERKTLMDRFFTVPASIGIHHFSIGGLAEHSLNVALMAERVIGIYGGNSDIIITGSLLHDIGKTEEIHFRGGFKYSDRGRLLGHITLGVMIFDDIRREMASFPDELATLLTHIILSHHGTDEWGSPRKPMCVEAIAIHCLDNLDAKVTGVEEYMIENMENERWTEYHRLYESKFYKPPEG